MYTMTDCKVIHVYYENIQVALKLKHKNGVIPVATSQE
jgi:hypothetical protein